MKWTNEQAVAAAETALETTLAVLKRVDVPVKAKIMLAWGVCHGLYQDLEDNRINMLDQLEKPEK